MGHADFVKPRKPGEKGEGLSLLERGWDAPCLNRNRKAAGAVARRGAIPTERLSAPERTREELRAI